MRRLILLVSLALPSLPTASFAQDEGAFDKHPLTLAEIEKCLKILKDDVSDELDGIEACFQLQVLGTPAIPHLLSIVKDPKQKHRECALFVIGELGVRARSTAPALMIAAEDLDPKIRTAALDALGKLQTDEGRVLPLLRKSLTHDDIQIRTSAAAAILRFQKDDADGINAIKLAFEHKEVRVRQAAATALRSNPAAGKNFVNLLAKTAKNSPLSLEGSYSLELLGELGPSAKESVPALVDIMTREPPKYEQLVAIENLRKIGPSAVPAVSALTKMLEKRRVRLLISGSEVDLGLRAAIAIEIIQGPNKGTREVLRDVSKADVGGQLKAAEHLAKDKEANDRAIKTLLAILKSENVFDRREAALILARLNHSGGVTELAKTLSIKGPADALELAYARPRWEAATALANLGPSAKSAIPMLNAAREQPYDEVLRATAAQAIKRLSEKPKS